MMSQLVSEWMWVWLIGILFLGEFLVVSIKGDPRSPLSSYHCQLCDCFFNDELAKRMHCKGRRHKLNYKVHIDI